MSDNQSNNKRIAKNTIMLYERLQLSILDRRTVPEILKSDSEGSKYITTETYKNNKQYLMGIAMILVIMYHISMHEEFSNLVQKTIQHIFGYGYVGVEMFFLLSTYGLCYSYNKNNLKKFYYNRFIRVVPLYPLALILTTAMNGGGNLCESICELLQQLTGFALFTDVKDPLWYMEALILLYCFFPFLYKFCMLLKRGGVTVILLICVSFHIILIVLPDFFLQAFIGRIPMMIVGVLTYIYNKEHDNATLYKIYGGLAILSVAPLLASRFFFVPAAMLLLSEADVTLFKKSLTFIGVHTFEIFIAHHFAQMTIGRVSSNYYVSLLVFLIVTVILSCLFHYVQNYPVKMIKCFKYS